jgi:membrane protein YqaA with SNARE-associated domain
LKTIFRLITKYKLWLLALLKPLGLWGVGCLAFADAAAVPVPIDPLIALYIWNDKRHFYLYVLMASLGSALGGLVPYVIGRAGGEAFLMRSIDRAKFDKLRDRFERQEFLALMVPSMLPPPTPWKLFVFCAGVFDMRAVNFMLAVFVGRVIRNSVTAWLTIVYGPRIVDLAQALALRHSRVLILGLVLLMAALASWVFLQKRHKRRRQKAALGH